MLWRGIGVDYEGGVLDGPARVAIQLAHRMMAVLVFGHLLVVSLRMLRTPGLVFWGSAAGPAAAGAGRAWHRQRAAAACRLWVATAHNAGAALLLFVLVGLLARLRAPEMKPRCRLPFSQYWQLTKPRVVALIVFTAVIGMFLADRRPADRSCRRGARWCSAASASGWPHRQRRGDQPPARPAHRRADGAHRAPAAADRLAELGAGAGVRGGAGRAVDDRCWSLFVNVLSAVLTFASLIGYAIVYTGWLKRATPQNIVIGGAAGAAPPVLGWAGGDQRSHYRIRAAAVPDHLRLDAAAFLGAGDLPPRGLRARA